MLRLFCEIGHFAKFPVILQNDQFCGMFAKWPKFLVILQNYQNLGQFAKLPVLALVTLQNSHAASGSDGNKRLCVIRWIWVSVVIKYSLYLQGFQFLFAGLCY